MVNIYICDDDPGFSEQMKNYILDYIEKSKYGDYDLKIRAFISPVQALEKCKEDKPDIIFLDIDMPEVNGFNIAGCISGTKRDTIIIFVSSHDNYVYSSLRFRPFRFIRKSHIASELKEALNSSLAEVINRDRFLELGSKYFNKRVLLIDILCFESKGNYAEITAKDGEKYIYRSTLTKLEDKLKDLDFVRVHAAFLINMRHIQQIGKDAVLLSNGDRVNISRRLHKKVLDAYSQYMRKQVF